MIPVCEPTLKGNELKYVSECVETNWISSGGSFIKKFEEAFSNYCGAKYGIGCANGTVAIHLALESMGVKPGDEVIVPDFTMIACTNAVLYAGAKPVFVDAEPETWCINPALVREKVSEKTTAIMPVHIYGHPCDMDEISKIAKEHSLLVMEDAAEAHGAEYKGKRCGSLGDAASFSFYANKIITTGEGGMVVTSDEKVAGKARLLRNHAFTPERFVHEEKGYNYRLTNLQAAVGVAQMERIDKLVEARRNNAKLYNEHFSKADWIITPPEKDWAKNVYWMYGILLGEKSGLTAKKARAELLEKGIDTRAFFHPMHLQPVLKKNAGWADIEGEFPVSEMLGRQGFYLPSSSHLTEEQIETIAKAVLALKK